MYAYLYTAGRASAELAGLVNLNLSAHLLPCRHGRVLRVGGRAVRSFAQRETSSGWRAAERAGRGFGGVLRGAQVWRAFGHAAAHGIQALPAGPVRRRPPGAIPRMLGEGLRDSAIVFAAC